MRLLNDKVLIKKYEVTSKDVDTGIEWSSDPEYLPRAVVISVSEELINAKDKVNIPEVGDHVYYTEPREKGKIKIDGVEHFALPYGNLVSII